MLMVGGWQRDYNFFKMKVSINKKIVNGPYGGGNQMLILIADYLAAKGVGVSFELGEDTDVVLMMDVKKESCCFEIEKILELKKRKGIKVVHRINDNGSHRHNNKIRDKMILDANKLADKTIFISEWVRDYFIERGFSGDHVVIHNAADRTLFKPSDRNRQTNEPLKIVTHHWSDNMSKGYDVYGKIDGFCSDNPNIASFRFIGRDCSFTHFSSICEKITAKPYKEIPQYLSSQDVYISASLFESGGCHIVEGMACGLIPLVRKGGGGTEDYSRGYGFVFNDATELIDYIRKLYEDYDFYLETKNKVKNEYLYNSDDMCKVYYEAII